MAVFTSILNICAYTKQKGPAARENPLPLGLSLCVSVLYFLFLLIIPPVFSVLNYQHDNQNENKKQK